MATTLKQLLIALVPLALLLVMTVFFVVSAKTYVRCENNNCESIHDNLGSILLTGDTAGYEPQAGDGEEIRRQKQIKKQEITALRYSGRLVFVFLINLYFFICFIGSILGVYIIYKSLKGSGVYVLGTGLVLIIGITVGIGLYLYNYPDTYMSVFNFLLENRIETDLAQAKALLVRVNSFGFAVCIMLYLTICTIIYSPVSETNPLGLVQASAKMKYLRTILYLGTLILVVGILLIRSLHQWSLVFMLRSEETLKTAENFFSNLLTVDGGFFTLVLAAAYLPAAFIVRQQVNQIQGLPQADNEREKMLENYHLTFSFTESLPKIIAILGPVLAGSIGELFTKLVK